MTEFRINTYTAGDQICTSTAKLSDGNFIVIWQSKGQAGNGWNIFGQKFTSVGDKLGSEFMINTDIIPNHLTSSAQWIFHPVAPLNNGGFVVVFEEQISGTVNYVNGDQWRVKARIFDNRNTGSSEIVISGSNENSSGWPSVATLENGNLLLTWTTYGTDGSGQGVYAQLFNQQLDRVSSIFQVNSYSYGDQMMSQPVGLSIGGFVIAWICQGQNSSVGIYAQRFDNNGNKVGTEFKSNNIANLQPDIASFSNGNFIIVGQSNGNGSPCKIYAQIFDSSGMKIGPEFLVNTYQIGDQAEPSVTTLNDDSFIITWSSGICCPESYDSRSQDGSGYGVFGQFFTNQGNKIDSEFRLNNFTYADQILSSQILLNNGKLFFTWQSNTQDGSGNGIYGKMYDLNNRETSSPSPTPLSFSSEDTSSNSFWDTVPGKVTTGILSAVGTAMVTGAVFAIKVYYCHNHREHIFCRNGQHDIVQDLTNIENHLPQNNNRGVLPNDRNAANLNRVVPIGVTLEEGKEISLISLEESKTYSDYDDDGIDEKTSWVSGDDAILVYDYNGNKMVDSAKEIVLSHWCPRLYN